MAREIEACKLHADEIQPAHFEKTFFDREHEQMAALGGPGAKISLKKDDMPKLFQ